MPQFVLKFFYATQSLLATVVVAFENQNFEGGKKHLCSEIEVIPIPHFPPSEVGTNKQQQKNP